MNPVRALGVAALLAGLGCGGGPAPVPASASAPAPAAASAPTPTPTPASASDAAATVRKALADLGSNSARARDRALETLVTLGEAAVPHLRAAEADARDADLAARMRGVLTVLGEEGPYAEAVAHLAADRYDAADRALERYRKIGRGRYRRQADYLAGEIAYLVEYHARFPNAVVRMETERGATAEELWGHAIHPHNLWLFLRSRGVEAPPFFTRALAAYELACQKDPKHRRAWTCRASLLAAAGRLDEARGLLESAKALPFVTGWDLMDLAGYHAVAGETDAALEVLGRAIERCTAERSQPDARWWARESNDFDPLRDDPRFTALVGDAGGR